MTATQVKEFFGISDILDLPNAVNKLLFDTDKETRNRTYRSLLEINNCRVQDNWFQDMYESDFAERKQKKQDFTPMTVATTASLIVQPHNGIVHEPTAGIGTMLIADWYETTQRYIPFQYFPSEHMIDCWELSERAIPLLLLNLAIRGMMGYVWHGDVLERNVIQKYILINEKDDALGFSEIYKADNNATIKKY